MNKKALVILAAGMGSRYGGLKQIDHVGDHGESIIDFSIYDAIRSGFSKLYLIIRKEHESLFEENLVRKIRPFIEVAYVYQQADDLPKGITTDVVREKPWGTTHALWACRHQVTEPFVAINADDFYGRNAFELIGTFLDETVTDELYGMVGYRLANTLSDHGSVTRGVCAVKDGYLDKINEVMKIEPQAGQVVYQVDDTWVPIDAKTPVSMNFWGFTPAIFAQLDELLVEFFTRDLVHNPQKGEALLPNSVGRLIDQGVCKVRVLTSEQRWFGVTYREDKPGVVAQIQKYKDEGLYPNDLWQK